MKRIIIFSICFIVSIVLITFIYNYYRGTPIGIFTVKEPVIEPNPWKPLCFIEPTNDSEYVQVTFQEKYGMEKTTCCKVLFKNDKTGDYKCVAPWNTVDIILSNINEIQYKKIKKSQCSN